MWVNGHQMFVQQKTLLRYAHFTCTSMNFGSFSQAISSWQAVMTVSRCWNTNQTWIYVMKVCRFKVFATENELRSFMSGRNWSLFLIGRYSIWIFQEWLKSIWGKALSKWKKEKLWITWNKQRINLLLVWFVRSFLVTELWVKQCGVLLCRKAQSLQPGNDKRDISDTLPSNNVSDAFCWYTFILLGPVVHKSDNAIQRIRVTKTYCAVCRLEIYPADSVIHSPNNGESGWVTVSVLP